MQKLHASKELVVSIHDVSPRTRQRAEEILADLARVGIGRASLLVIPDHHRRGRISEDAAFARWLAARCAEGHEAVLHGYFHLRENHVADGPWKRFVTRSYTAGEGEFYDLDGGQAGSLLEQGLRDMAACGVSPVGFIAPAWLLGEAAGEAVRAAGFEYTTRIATVSDLVSGATHSSRSQVWSVRAPWRRTCSLAWNALLFCAASSSRLARIGIHPPDWEHPAIRRQVLRLAERSAAAREPMTYAGWVRRLRHVPGEGA